MRIRMLYIVGAFLLASCATNEERVACEQLCKAGGAHYTAESVNWTQGSRKVECVCTLPFESTSYVEAPID